jgi:hypothetical protein
MSRKKTTTFTRKDEQALFDAAYIRWQSLHLAEQDKLQEPTAMTFIFCSVHLPDPDKFIPDRPPAWYDQLLQAETGESPLEIIEDSDLAT